jgi:hypothetical protein
MTETKFFKRTRYSGGLLAGMEGFGRKIELGEKVKVLDLPHQPQGVVTELCEGEHVFWYIVTLEHEIFTQNSSTKQVRVAPDQLEPVG